MFVDEVSARHGAQRNPVRKQLVEVEPFGKLDVLCLHVSNLALTSAMLSGVARPERSARVT